MGTRAMNYCDGCGDDIGDALLTDAIQVLAIGTNGMPSVMYLCTKPERENFDELGKRPFQAERPPMPKYTGCAKKILSKTQLSTLYGEVAKFTGDENDKPFPL